MASNTPTKKTSTVLKEVKVELDTKTIQSSSQANLTISDDSKLIASLAYLGQLLFGFLAFIISPFLIMGFLVPMAIWLFKKNEDEYVAFHAKQALVYSILTIIVTIIMAVILGIAFLLSFISVMINPGIMIVVFGLALILFLGVSIISFGYFVLGIINCFSGKKKKLPLIGWIGEKF